MIGKSKYLEPSRELLVGVKQWGRGIELALEFPSEIKSRIGRKPIVIGVGYRYMNLYLDQKSGRQSFVSF